MTGMLYLKHPPTDAFSSAPVGHQTWAWGLLHLPPAPRVFCVPESGETHQVTHDVMKSWDYEQAVMESSSTGLLEEERQRRTLSKEKQSNKINWQKIWTQKTMWQVVKDTHVVSNLTTWKHAEHRQTKQSSQLCVLAPIFRFIHGLWMQYVYIACSPIITFPDVYFFYIFDLICSYLMLLWCIHDVRVSPKSPVFWTCAASQRSEGWPTGSGESFHLQTTTTTAAAAADSETCHLRGRREFR